MTEFENWCQDNDRDVTDPDAVLDFEEAQRAAEEDRAYDYERDER